MRPNELGGSGDDATIAMLRAENEMLHARLAEATAGQGGGAHALARELESRTDALVISERKFRGLFELAPIGLALVDPDGRFAEANQAMQDLLGYDLTALRRLTVIDVTYPADQDTLRDLYQGMIAGEREVIDLELRCSRQDSGVIWIHCTVHLIRDAAGEPRVTLGMADITQRVRARAAREASWTQYQRLVEQSPDTIVVHSQGQVRYINPAGLRLLRAHSPEDVVGRSVLDFVLPEYQELVRERIQVVQGEGDSVPRQEMRFYRLDGSVVDVETVSAAIEFDGQPASQVIVQDTTERRRAQEELRRVNAELSARNAEFEKELASRTEDLRASEAAVRAQYAELQRLARLKDDLVNAVSHELRTPLTSIRGFAEFLEDGIGGELSEVQLGYVAQIQEGALRLQRLVDDLLDFARLEAASFKLDRQDVDLVRLAQEAVESLRPLAGRKGLALRLLPPPAPVRASVDAGRIGQVVINFVGNAIKFTPEGGSIEVEVTEVAAGARIAVRDTGVGIAAEHIPHLFEKFYQVEPSLTREAGGAGLGLSISKSLIEAHGGRIGAESVPGVGSTFWIEVPREAPREARPAP